MRKCLLPVRIKIAISACVCWSLEKKTKEILPIIDDNEEKLANILEKGNDLLNTDFI